MRKILILSLALTLLLAACGKVDPPMTTDVPITTQAPETTVPMTTEIPETTETPVTTEPLMQVTFEEADKIEKQAKDHFNGGDFDFKHSIVYMRLLSDKPGAVALNEKIKLLYAPMIEKLRNDKEGNELYRIGFNAAYTGKDYSTLMIHFTEFGGWQYSEGGTTQRFFYYDGINDRELTVEEYLAAMDVDIDKAMDKALWSYDLASAGGTADLDGENPNHGADVNLRIPGSSEILGATAENVFYEQRFTQFGNSVNLDGAYVDYDTVTLYFGACIYTTYTFSVTLDKETLEPVRPNYQAAIRPTAADTDRIEILFENGNVASATAPSMYASDRITVKSHKVEVLTKGNYNDAVFSINGSAPKSWSTAATANENESLYYFYTDGYIPYDELESVVIYPSKSIAPPIETAVHYERDAYSIYSGGKIGKQLITYPRITTGTASAKKLNNLISDELDPIIKELEKGNDHKTYNVKYGYTLFDGCISIVIDYSIGRQGTEGGEMRKMFYFDLANDRVLTMDEYIARLNIDIEKAKDGALWSYDLGSAGYAGGDAICADTLGGDEIEPENGKFYYKKYGAFDKSVAFDGIGVSESEVVLYMTGHAFTSNIFTVTLDKATLLPIRPNYALKIDASSAKDGEFEIRLSDGEVNSVTLPEGTKNVTISASYISFDSDIPFKADTFKINGEKWGLGYNASFDPDTGGYGYSFHISPYVPPKMLKSITIEKR